MARQGERFDGEGVVLSVDAGLEIDAVDFSYRSKRPVLAGVSWVPGQRSALLGPNGAGKSTLFGVACGALRPRRGSVEVGGSAVRPGRVGLMPQTIAALPSLRCQEQVALAGWMQGLSRTAAWEAAVVALDAVDLGSRASERASTLSGGQLRRLGVAEVLVAEPDVVLLDEPTVGLDPLQRDQVRALIAGLGDRCQVVVATHLVEDLETAFDTVTVLVDGTVRFDGSVEEFLGLSDAGGGFSKRATAAYAAAVGSAR